MERRTAAARFGVTLLNLLVPGLGLLRLGLARRAGILYGLIVASFLVFLSVLATTDAVAFPLYVAAAGLVLLVTVTAFVVAIGWTWRDSRTLTSPLPAWSRWYSLLGAVLIAVAVNWLLTDSMHRMYRNFYVPSEAMEPTLDKNDRFLASMRPRKMLQRGDVVLVRAAAGRTYVKRLAGLPGDFIAMKGGQVFLNGKPVALAPAGARNVGYPYIDARQARVFRERFPGEASSHAVQDLGPTAEDEFGPVEVPADHLFLLGDNRDDSADSRVPKWMGGLEMVAVSDVLGRPLFFYWPMNKMGRPVAGSHEL